MLNFLQGFFLIVSPDTALEVSKIAFKNKKLFIVNLSAPYICHDFNKNLSPLLPYADVVFGNETVSKGQSRIETKSYHSKYNQYDFLNIELIYHGKGGSITQFHNKYGL